MKKYLSIILIILALSFPGDIFAQFFEQDRVEIQQILDKYNIPGAAIAVIDQDSVNIANFGYDDVANQISVSRATQFGVGSISKTFLALAIMHAEEKGLLNIDSPLAELLPQSSFSNDWEKEQPVRLIHLLEHTSGFDEAHFNLFAQTNSKSTFSEIINLSRSALITRWKPGKYYAYNNLGYVLAASVLEKKSGMTFASYVRQNILLPLQMDKASYHPSEEGNPHLAKGYSGVENVEEPLPSLPQWPAGSLVINIEGMTTLVQMLLNQGDYNGTLIVDSTTLLSMETAETSIRAQHGIVYEYGKGLMKRNEKGHVFYGHNGSYGGFLSDFGYSRALDKAYVIMINNREGNKAIKAIKEVLLRNITVAPKEGKTVFSSNPEVEVNITGGYQPITTNFELSRFAMRLIDIQIIVEKDGQVYQKSIVGDEQLLIPMGGGKFRKQNEPSASSLIIQDDKDIYLMDETAYQQIPVWSAYLQFYISIISLTIVIFTLLGLLFIIPYRLLKRNIRLSFLSVLQFVTALSFLSMLLSIAYFYDATKLYSVGAITFNASGWLFIFLSVVLVVFTVKELFEGNMSKRAVKVLNIAFSFTTFLIATYLVYWGIIGLKLWAY